MKKIGFLPNIEKDTGLIYTKELVNWALANEWEVLLLEDAAKILDRTELLPEFSLHKNSGAPQSFAILSKDEDRFYSESDFVIVLGGDGTILRAAKKSALHRTPIIGINLGNMGYLTDVEKNDAKTAISKVFNGSYKIENRMMLQASITKNNSETITGIALNEVCVNNGIFSRMVEISLYLNDEYINTYKSDGVIISTPTGSTAYNLSAGGPILKPDTELIAITPICPHTLYNRPLVISGNDVIKIKPLESKSGVYVSLDGKNNANLNEGDTLIIKKSNCITRIIKTNDLGFYDILRRKL